MLVRLVRVRNLFYRIRSDLRNAALQQFIQTGVDWLTFHMGEVQHEPEPRAVVERLARSLSANSSRTTEVRAATLIAEGALQGHNLLQALVLFIVSMCDKSPGPTSAAVSVNVRGVLEARAEEKSRVVPYTFVDYGGSGNPTFSARLALLLHPDSWGKQE